MWYRTPVSKTASISGDSRPRRPWAPNAPRPTPATPASAPINTKVRSIAHILSGAGQRQAAAGKEKGRQSPAGRRYPSATAGAGLYRGLVQHRLDVLFLFRPAE